MRTRDICIIFSCIRAINCDEMLVDGIGIITSILLGVNLCKPSVHNYIVGLMCFCLQEDFERVSNVAQLEIHLGKPFLLREDIRIGESRRFQFHFHHFDLLNEGSLSPVEFNPLVIHFFSEKCVRCEFCGF